MPNYRYQASNCCGNSKRNVSLGVPSGSGCHEHACSDNTSNISMQVLAMAYVPIQKFQCLYDPPKGLHAGTIFAELDKPFLGTGGVLR